MTAGDGRGRKFTVNGRPIRPSPSGLKKDGAVPSWLRTDGKPPSRPVLSDVGRTGRLTTLRPLERPTPARFEQVGTTGAWNFKFVHLVIHFQEPTFPWPSIPDTIPPTYAPSHGSQYALQKFDQCGDYEKMLDFTRRLKFQQIINHLYATLHCLIRVTIMRNFWNVHSLSISAQSPTVMPQAVKSSAWPVQFRKSNGLIWPGLQATDPTAGRPGLSGTLTVFVSLNTTEASAEFHQPVSPYSPISSYQS
ncbi:hypothetical protein BDD12DRAFT_884195 [Trichophaea hybrida]|nr:hypothetical protein BDD12DRAFT_884195 [Trichophaea hybrida]